MAKDKARPNLKTKKNKSQLKESNITDNAPVLADTLPKGSWFEGAVAAFFTAAIILIVRMHVYERPMQQFYWNGGRDDLTDFFSYYKMVGIIVCTILVLLIILYHITTQTFHMRKSKAYPFMLVYAILVALSYAFSDYKDFSLYGFNDRFEGTVVLISYMIMLYFIYNFVNREKNVKWIIYPIAGSSVLLGLLGLSQALDHDFFRTTIGKKLITPTFFWDQLDTLNFTFQNREIYQTVYNINYVSFYITLFIPVFGLIFIYEEGIKKKVLWGGLFLLSVYNLIGSQSSGGFLGLGVVVLMALVVLNKRLLHWKKPILALLAITVLVGGLTYERWSSELFHTYKGVVGENNAGQQIVPEDIKADDIVPGGKKPYIDYIDTSEDSVTMSINGEPLTVKIGFNENGQADSMSLFDKNEEPIAFKPGDDQGIYAVLDDRFFQYLTFSYAEDEGQYYILINTPEMQWVFAATDGNMVHRNQLGKNVEMKPVESIGWKNNQDFGSGRGYIWSRTLPMMKDTILLGHGADTYCIYYPHYDYAGKYNADWEINKVVDKPHNMYMGMAVGTGILSMLVLLILFGMYLVQSFRLYYRHEFNSFSSYAGMGIFLGISGFLAAGLVNDSSVSVMPMFYGLLATGMGINGYLTSEDR